MDKRILEYFQKDRFASENGIVLVECRPGYAVAEMSVTDRHLNAAGVVQGGALFTLADLAFAAAVNAHGKTALSITATVSFFQKKEGGKLTAVAKEISRNNRLSTAEVTVRDETHAIIISFMGTAYITQHPNLL